MLGSSLVISALAGTVLCTCVSDVMSGSRELFVGI